MKKYILSLMMGLCVSVSSFAQSHSDRISVGAGALYQRGLDATISWEHETRYHNAWEYFINGYIKWDECASCGHVCPESFWNNYRTWGIGVVSALLGNPYFKMTEFLKVRIGEHQYKAPRKDGNQRLVIDEALIEEFAELEAVQFDCCNPYYKDRVWGLFGERDSIAHFCPLFMEHYSNVFRFPGGHTPTEQEVKAWYAPLAQKMLMDCPVKEYRYFQHFKGGKYKFFHSAFDSETLERMVVYQALYGQKAYWVRPEKMFFGKVTRDGRTFNRFTEVDM